MTTVSEVLLPKWAGVRGEDAGDGGIPLIAVGGITQGVVADADGTMVVDGALRVLQVQAPCRRCRVWVVGRKVEGLGLATRNSPRVVSRNEHGEPRNGG